MYRLEETSNIDDTVVSCMFDTLEKAQEEFERCGKALSLELKNQVGDKKHAEYLKKKTKIKHGKTSYEIEFPSGQKFFLNIVKQ